MAFSGKEIADKTLNGAAWLKAHWEIVGLMAVGLGLRLWGIAMTSPISAASTPLPDDAFYYFSLGRNLATGYGPRVDALHFTTGFQPLWGALVTVAFAIAGNDALAISLTQLLGAVADVGTAGLLYALVQMLSGSKRVALLMGLWWLISPQAAADSLNGLETPLAICTVVAIFYSLKWLLNGFSHLLGFAIGLIYGLAVLARVDTLILLGVVFVVWMINGIRSGEQPEALVRRIATIILGMSLPLLPWLWFTQLYGKSIIPESGSAVRVITLVSHHLPVYTLVESLQHHPTLFSSFYGQQLLEFTAAWGRWTPVLLPLSLPLYALNNSWLTVIIPAVISGCAGIILVILAIRDGSKLQKVAAIVWILYTLGMTLAYSLFVLGPWFYRRYSVSVALIFSLLAVSSISYRARRHLDQPNHRYSKLIKRLINKALLAYTIIITATIISLYAFGLYRWLIYGPATVPDDGVYQTVQWLNENVPASARVGVFQSGLIGYYARPPVFNLDGKVNAEARLALVKGAMWEYLCRENIAYIADWPSLIDSFLIKGSASKWQDDYLTPLHQIQTGFGGTMNIYRVNRQKCPPQQN